MGLMFSTFMCYQITTHNQGTVQRVVGCILFFLSKRLYFEANVRLYMLCSTVLILTQFHTISLELRGSLQNTDYGLNA